MKVKKIYYEELRTVGQFNNKKVGIELEVESGEKAVDVIHKAKLFVQSQLSSENLNADLLESVVRRVKGAQEAMQDLADKAQSSLKLDDEIPF